MLTDKYMVNLSMSSLPDFSYSAPKEYPEIGVYHPRIKGKIAGSAQELPKVVSKKAKKRMVGLFAVIAGSFFAIIVQLYLGLYYFVFANAFWLLNACNGIKKITKTKNKRVKNF